jgi:exopolysaccharide biosynthesis polyprenyl glycosylphosphotransferase
VKTRPNILIFIILDALVIIAAWHLAIYFRYGELTALPPYPEINLYPLYISIALILTIGILSALGAYKGRYHPVAPVFKAALLTFLISNVIFLYFKDFAFSRLSLFYFSFLFLAMAIGWRIVNYVVIDSKWGRTKFHRKVIIVGLGKDADFIYQRMRKDPFSSYEIIGFVGDVKESSVAPGEKHILGPPEKLGEMIQMHSVDEVIITQDDMPAEEWIRLIGVKVAPAPMFRIVPHGVDIFLSRTPPEQLDYFPSIQYLMDPLTSSEKVIKRGFDLLISTTILLLLSPILLAVAVLIRIERSGKVFYVQERIGKNGKVFRLFKFRSMVEDAEQVTGPVWAEKDDKRVTGVGRFIRRTGLDEFPQLINVLRGEMSLVGPRPERPFFVKQHPELTQWRLSVKPGLTGLAQIHGRYDISLEEKVQYDLYYIQNYSLALDIEILIRTFVMIAKEELSRSSRRVDR